MKGTLNKLIFNQVSIAPLVTFRILFGSLMALGMLRFWLLGWVDRLFVEPMYFFKFSGFEWVTVPSPMWVYALNALAIISALCIALGFLYRIATLTFLLSFAYIELMDASNYLNHYYLVVLFGGMLVLLPANRKHALDVKFGLTRPLDRVPAVAINILIAQMVIVYTFAGMAKLNSDWLLRAMPLRVWLPEHAGLPLIGSLLALPETAFVFSWFGALYDLTIGYFMLWKRTRPYAYIFVILFHAITGLLFNIGLFPVIMICCTTIFFSARKHEKWHKAVGLTGPASPEGSPMHYRSWVKPLVVGYLLVQVILPLRHLVYPGNVLVTEEGYRFSWRVMLVEKAGTTTFRILDKTTGRSSEIINSRYLTPFQEKQMSIQPDFMLQYARIIAEDYKSQVSDPAVYVDARVTLNGRVSAQFVDPERDLLAISDQKKPRDWVIARKFRDFK